MTDFRKLYHEHCIYLPAVRELLLLLLLMMMMWVASVTFDTLAVLYFYSCDSPIYIFVAMFYMFVMIDLH
jgi:hypothetical protein